MKRKTAHIDAANAAWSFAGIEHSFDEHVEKSVPLYHEGHKLVCSLTDFFVPGGGLVTEIGCATGTLAKRLSEHHKDIDFRYLGIDPVPGMVDFASRRCADDKRISIIKDDVITRELETSSVFI